MAALLGCVTFLLFERIAHAIVPQWRPAARTSDLNRFDSSATEALVAPSESSLGSARLGTAGGAGAGPTPLGSGAFYAPGFRE